MSIKGEIYPPTLYVYETVEIDLSLPDGEMETHLITLHEGTYTNSYTILFFLFKGGLSGKVFFRQRC